MYLDEALHSRVDPLQRSWENQIWFQEGQTLKSRQCVLHSFVALGEDAHECYLSQAEHETSLDCVVQLPVLGNIHLTTVLPIPAEDEEIC